MTSIPIHMQPDPVEHTRPSQDAFTGSEPSSSRRSSLKNADDNRHAGGNNVDPSQHEEPWHAASTDDSHLQEQTMVASEDAHSDREAEEGEKRVSKTLSTQSEARQDDRHSETEEKEHEEIAIQDVSDPLRAPEIQPVQEMQELTVVVDAVDSGGGMIYSTSEKKPSPVASRRTSHLHLDLKPPSPQPWDLVDPPTSDSRKGGPDFYSTLGSRKFHTLQSTTHTRPLIPKSSYYFGPPPSDSAFGTAPIGQIGVHHPREIIRIERDYTGGELIQFAPIYPLELEGRITPTHFLESINAINERLISAHSLRHSFIDNTLAVFSLQLSKLFWTSHYEKEMQRLQYLIEDLNTGLYNPVGLNILCPRNVAFLFLEIEYYVSVIYLFGTPCIYI